MTPPRLLSSCRWLLPLGLLLVLLAMLRHQPEAVQTPAAATPVMQRVSSSIPRFVDTAPLDTFDAWLVDEHHVETLAHGIELARERRDALKQLIQVDPQAALAHAVPYAVRRELPREIVKLLETPVSTTADLVVEIACGLPGGGSRREQWITLDDDRRLQVFTYGDRAEGLSKHKLSVHGIAIDDVMAMLDDPLREWSAEEAADHGHSRRIAQLGRRLLEIESDEALASARQQLRQSEEILGPVALPAYRELALGEMDGMVPIAMQNGDGGSNDDDLPPIAFSAWTEGPKTMLYIRARFANEPSSDSVPLALATAQSRQAGAENFWFENSYAKSSLATTFTDVVTLPSNSTAYFNNFNKLLTDARQAAVAANSNWNFDNFNFYTVITTGTQGNFGYIGIAQFNDKGSHLLKDFTTIRTASHEYGHNLGLNHSEYWLTDSPSPIGRDSIPGGYVGDTADAERIEYGHKFAVMGSQDLSGDFENGRAHYTASDKNRLDWLVQADGDIVSTTTSGTFQLYRHDVPADLLGFMTPGVTRAIKINLNASDPTGFPNPYRYWLNYRNLPTDGIANNWLRNGLQVDWRRDAGGFRAVMLDMTPFSRDSGPYGLTPGMGADNNDKEDGVVLIGRTFSDTGADIHFTPIARGGDNPNEWLQVVVNIGTQGGNTAPVISNFTVTNPNPAVGQVINFNVTASDPDGDALAYHWDVGDNTVQSSQLNLNTRGKQWGTAGYYTVRCEVSDMKGGRTTVSRVIQVGSPANNGMIYGRVTHAGRPVEGVLIRGGDLNTWTNSDGTYVLAGLPVGNATVTAAKDGLTFTALFTNPVQATDFGAFGIDFTANEPWTGGGGTVVMLSPVRVDLPLGFAAKFIAQAFDGSGNPVAFNPAWSVSGGGTIDSSGVFTAQNIGGPFNVTAQDGSLSATATLNVIDTGGPALANGTWTNASGGSWATNGNWSGNIIAAGAGNTADFSTLNPTADTTVTLDAARSIGSLIFGDTNTGSTATWFLSNGTNGSLMLAGATPTITVNSLANGKFANINARLSGFDGFTKNGSGNLILNNATNTLSGPIILNAGNIQLNNASLTNATSVAINAGALVVATANANAIGGTISFGGGNLQFNNVPGTDHSPQFSTTANQPYRISVGGSNEVTFASNLASPGGTLTKLGTGTLILGASNGYSGDTTLSAGTLRFGNAAALGGGPLAITGNSTLQAGLAASLPNAISIANGITGTLDTNEFNTTLAGTLTGAGNLTKSNTGTLTLTSGTENTLAGTININAGRLDVLNGLALTNVPATITVATGAVFNYSKNFTNGNDLANALSLSGPSNGGFGALNLRGNVTATGPITLAADATISHDFNTATISSPITGTDRNLTLTTITTGTPQPGMTVSGPITLGTGGITVQGVANSGNFSIRLSGNNSYTGETHVASGTLMLSGSARIDDAATVRIATGAVLHLDFTGTDTVGALFLGGVAMPDGSYGSSTSTAANKSADFLGNGVLQVGAAYNYASWAANQVPPITGGANGDDDNDGVKNLVEYALVDGGERGVLSGSTLTFTKRGAPYGGDLTYIIETSETLEANSWSPAVTHGPAQLGSDISYTFDPNSQSRKFARLKVVQTP